MSIPIIVQKYGGSSVATPEHIARVADQVLSRREQGCRLVVVVSAMGRATDDLLAMAQRIAPDPDRRELDMLLTVGERISMALLAMAVRARGCDAVSLTGSQSGILTTASHTNARIMEVRPFRIQDELERGRVVIVAGYQGVSYQREITTLGRGGTDTTAVALAAALDAEACEIYSDVDGVWTADPRLLDDARRIDAIGYDEMESMAKAGARVLHDQAVAFAREKGIALYARKTGSSEPGTVVRRDGTPAAKGLTAICHRPRIAWTTADTTPSSWRASGFRVDAVLRGPGLNWTVLDPTDYTGPWPPRGLKTGASVSVVGPTADGQLESLVEVLARAGVEPSWSWTMPGAANFIVGPQHVEVAVRALHELVGT